jgi:two-component sensor histidine kinase
VQTIALIHEYMYQSDNLARLPLSENIRGLAANMLRAAGSPTCAVALEVEVEEQLTLPVDRAIPCGLILNELMTNALKHAFTDRRSGVVRVTLRKQGAELVLGVADDGVGMPGDYASNVKGSLGWRLVKAFADQLGAWVRVSADRGTQVEIGFSPEG